MKKEIPNAATDVNPETKREHSTKVLDFPAADTEVREQKQVVTEQLSHWAAALDRSYSGWSSTVKTARLIGEHAVVTVTVSAAGSEREGIGYARFTGGSGFLTAEQMAFCEAASKFVSNGTPLSFEILKIGVDDESPVVATCLSDLITRSQLRVLRSLARSKGIDPDTECEKRFGCFSAELSRKAASIFLAELQSPAMKRMAGLMRAG
jgi:hypothetical protein